jgi:hypothetical protein
MPSKLRNQPYTWRFARLSRTSPPTLRWSLISSVSIRRRMMLISLLVFSCKSSNLQPSDQLLIFAFTGKKNCSRVQPCLWAFYKTGPSSKETQYDLCRYQHLSRLFSPSLVWETRTGSVPVSLSCVVFLLINHGTVVLPTPLRSSYGHPSRLNISQVPDGSIVSGWRNWISKHMVLTYYGGKLLPSTNATEGWSTIFFCLGWLPRIVVSSTYTMARRVAGIFWLTWLLA